MTRCDKDRLKEGSNINKSLVTLGIVIQTLGRSPVTLDHRYVSSDIDNFHPGPADFNHFDPCNK